MNCLKSFPIPVVYLLHAYDYQPNDPLVCLSLTIASLGRAMQRQSDNRNYLIVQAMGFITKYRQFRLVQSKLREAEVEYNYGRGFHQICKLHTILPFFTNAEISVPNSAIYPCCRALRACTEHN